MKKVIIKRSEVLGCLYSHKSIPKSFELLVCRVGYNLFDLSCIYLYAYIIYVL